MWSCVSYNHGVFMSFGLAHGMVPDQKSARFFDGVPPLESVETSPSRTSGQSLGNESKPLVATSAIAPPPEAQLRQDFIELLIRLGSLFLGLGQQYDGFIQRKHFGFFAGRNVAAG